MHMHLKHKLDYIAYLIVFQKNQFKYAWEDFLLQAYTKHNVNMELHSTTILQSFY
jgi:hypothetical protein